MSTVRKVQVFSTKGKRRSTIETDASKWSELRNLIENEGYDVGTLHATENINRTDLAHDDAVLPEGDFTLFLRPKKTKSGIDGLSGKTFKELRAIAKEYKEKDGDKFIDHLNANPQEVNWTRLSAVDLKAQMDSYGEVTESAQEAVIEETEAEAVVIQMNNQGRLYLIGELLNELIENSTDDFLEVRCEDIVEEIDELKELVVELEGETPNIEEFVKAATVNPAEIDKLKSRIADCTETIEDLTGKLNKKQEEKDALEAEADSLAKGFNY